MCSGVLESLYSRCQNRGIALDNMCIQDNIVSRSHGFNAPSRASACFTYPDKQLTRVATGAAFTLPKPAPLIIA